MKYTIKMEGKSAEANFQLLYWNGYEWIDATEDLEINVHDGTEMTLKQYKDILHYWQSEINSGEIGDWDMSGEWAIEATDPEEL